MSLYVLLMNSKTHIKDEFRYNGFSYILTVGETSGRNGNGEEFHNYHARAYHDSEKKKRHEYPVWMSRAVSVETDAVAAFSPDDIAEEVLDKLKREWEQNSRRRLSERDVTIPDDPDY